MHLDDARPLDHLRIRSSSRSSRRSFLVRRASSSTTEFFTSGRAAPWWLIGVSMVATTFSTDTPNLVTNLVREQRRRRQLGLVGVPAHRHGTVFFYARMWRRSGVLTDLEFYEIRYSGKPATFVRGFRAVYLGLFFNFVIMATVNLAAAKIAQRAARLADVADAARLRGDQRSRSRRRPGSGACWSPTSIQFVIAMTGIVRRGRITRCSSRRSADCPG